MLKLEVFRLEVQAPCLDVTPHPLPALQVLDPKTSTPHPLPPLQVLHDLDKEALKALSADYEIDFLSLSFCRMADDVLEARSFLKSIGLTNTKVQQMPAVCSRNMSRRAHLCRRRCHEVSPVIDVTHVQIMVGRHT